MSSHFYGRPENTHMKLTVIKMGKICIKVTTSFQFSFFCMKLYFKFHGIIKGNVEICQKWKGIQAVLTFSYHQFLIRKMRPKNFILPKVNSQPKDTTGAAQLFFILCTCFAPELVLSPVFILSLTLGNNPHERDHIAHYIDE